MDKVQKSLNKSISQIDPYKAPRFNSPVANVYGCRHCEWLRAKVCPHNLKRGEKHANDICGERRVYLKDHWDKATGATKFFQADLLVTNKLFKDQLVADWYDRGEIPEMFPRISREITTLTDKMRKQDEGIKVQNEVSIAVQDFQKIVEIQAELVKGRDIVKEAEFIDNQPNPA